MVCEEMKIWWQYVQNLQGLFTSIPICLKKKWKIKDAFGSKTLKIWFFILWECPMIGDFIHISLSIKNYYLFQKRSNYKVRLTSKILYKQPKTVFERET